MDLELRLAPFGEPLQKGRTLFGEILPAAADVRLRRRVERMSSDGEDACAQVKLLELKRGTASAGLKAQQQNRVAVTTVPGWVDIIPASALGRTLQQGLRRDG